MSKDILINKESFLIKLYIFLTFLCIYLNNLK